MTSFVRAAIMPIILATLAAPVAEAQDRSRDAQEKERPARIESLPGYDRYEKVSEALRTLNRTGRVRNVEWSDDGTELTFRHGEVEYRLDLESHELHEQPEAEETGQDTVAADRPRPRRPRRGHQRGRERSPDGRWVAVCRDWNVVLEAANEPGAGGEDSDAPREVVEVTTDGTRKHRYGQASWVYGEELRQTTAMWWSPDSTKLAFYELDERGVEDFYLLNGLTERRTSVAREGYPKPGEPNPVAGLMLYDVRSGALSRMPVGPSPQHYVYKVRFSPDGADLLFHRTNRHQNMLEIVAVDIATLTPRVVVTEVQRTWQSNRPTMRFLDDGRRFVWETEKSGFRHYELRDLDGRLISPLTSGRYPVDSIVYVDQERETLFYTAWSDPNPLNRHLHRVGLDGAGAARLTREPLHHSIQVSPDGAWFIITAEAVGIAPRTSLCAADGTQVATLAEADTTPVEQLGLQAPEHFTFTADDGVTELYGVLFKPSEFDARKKYPLLIDVYGGPESRRVTNAYRAANAYCELGFLIATIDNRGTRGRGKAFKDAVYMQLGSVDLKDQVDGVRHLLQREYLDPDRVGIYGRSYGGYMAALAILRYPDVFRAAVAGAPVTDWRNYDSIYTERYMRTPEENPNGYDTGSCLEYVDQLEGHLLIMHGMVDNNVHPNNAWQLVDALHRADKRFEMVFFPDAGHSLASAARTYQWEFLIGTLGTVER